MKAKLAPLLLLTFLIPQSVQAKDSCSALFATVTEVNVVGPRTSNDYWEPQTPPYKAKTKEGTDYVAGVLPFQHPKLKELSAFELTRLLQDERFAASIYAKTRGAFYTYDYLAERGWLSHLNEIKRVAAILLSRQATPNLVPGRSLTRNQFEYQAKLLGGVVQKHDLVYRVDSRPPEEIVAAGGFWPNPNKKPYTLWENVYPDIDGGANFVSTTSMSSNGKAAQLLTPKSTMKLQVPSGVDLAHYIRSVVREVLGATGSASDSKMRLTKRFDEKLEASLLKTKGEPYILEVSLHEGYEYKLGPVIGMETPDAYGIPGEREVVTSGVPASAIRDYVQIEALKVRVLRSFDERYMPEILEIESSRPSTGHQAP